MTVRFGLLGYGLFGSHHARVIDQNDKTSLVAVAAQSPDSRAAAQGEFPAVEVAEDYREVIQRDDIDIVDIVLPNQLHHEAALAAIRAGKHVLLEKPMALTWEHCDELVEAADAAGVVLAVGHELRLSSVWGGAKQLIDPCSARVGRTLAVPLPSRLGRMEIRHFASGKLDSGGADPLL